MMMICDSEREVWTRSAKDGGGGAIESECERHCLDKVLLASRLSMFDSAVLWV